MLFSRREKVLGKRFLGILGLYVPTWELRLNQC